jgi:hypothetical protein
MPSFPYLYAAGGAPTCAVAPGNALPGLANPLLYTWAALKAATLMVGVYPPGGMAQYEVTWRQAALRAGSYTNAGILRGTPLAARLDATELGGISYSIGMALAVFGANQAGFVNPQHMSRYMAAHPFAVNYGGSLLRPDLIFVNPGAATVQIWEAKGRRNAGAPGVLGGAMGQANAVVNVTVGGAAIVPNARVASVAMYRTAGNHWDLHVTDPADFNLGGLVDPSARDGFYVEFYRPFMEMLDDSRLPTKITRRFADRSYQMVRLDESGMWMGIYEPIASALRARSDARPGQLADFVESQIAQFVREAGRLDESANWFVNTNGILAVTDDDWNVQSAADTYPPNDTDPPEDGDDSETEDERSGSESETDTDMNL